MKHHAIMLFGLCVLTMLSTELEAKRQKKVFCRLENKKGLRVVCDSRRVPRSKFSTDKKAKRTKVQKDRITKRQKFNLKMSKCQEMSGEWVLKEDILTSLTALYAIKCPPSHVLQEMGMEESETSYRTAYKCCQYVAVLKR